MEKMPKNGDIRFDERGHAWEVNLQLSTQYPNGMINKLVLTQLGYKTVVRYNEAGDFIDGNPALA